VNICTCIYIEREREREGERERERERERVGAYLVVCSQYLVNMYTCIFIHKIPLYIHVYIFIYIHVYIFTTY